VLRHADLAVDADRFLEHPPGTGRMQPPDEQRGVSGERTRDGVSWPLHVVRD
jgi:hypothetical protein